MKAAIMAINPTFIVYALIALAAYLLIEMIIINDLLSEVHSKKDFWIAFKATVIGQYYSLITPFASGGQPAQVYYMQKDDVPISKSTAVLVNKFLLFQIGVTVYALVLFVLNFSFYMTISKEALTFAGVGLVINLLGLFILCMVFINPDWMKRILRVIVARLAKWKLIKKPDEKIEKWVEQVDHYKCHMDEISKNKMLLFKSVVLTFVQLTVYFSITFFIYKAFNLTGVSFFKILALQSFLYMSVSFIPTPGTMGSGELGFYAIFALIFNHVVLYALIIWRLISFYFLLITCGLLTLFFHIQQKRKENAMKLLTH